MFDRPYIIGVVFFYIFGNQTQMTLYWNWKLLDPLPFLKNAKPGHKALNILVTLATAFPSPSALRPTGVCLPWAWSISGREEERLSFTIKSHLFFFPRLILLTGSLTYIDYSLSCLVYSKYIYFTFQTSPKLRCEIKEVSSAIGNWSITQLL